MRFIHIEAAFADRISCALARQRRQRHAATCYEAARTLCNRGEWQAARHQLDRAHHFLMSDQPISDSMNQFAELERIINTALNPLPAAAKRTKSRLTR